jgi:hypothetical protein
MLALAYMPKSNKKPIVLVNLRALSPWIVCHAVTRRSVASIRGGVRSVWKMTQ